MPWKKRVGIPHVKRETIKIDATEQVVGRLATKIAMILMGKHRPDYNPALDMGDRVEVANVDKIIFTGKKMDQKKYYRTSNRPGGLKVELAKDIFDKNPEEILRHAVKYMLPKNKTQALRMKRLTFVK